MNTKISIILLALAAEALVGIGFFVLIPENAIPNNIRWLDFTVTTILVAIFTANMVIPLVNTSDKSHKEVAALGIRWTAVGWYSALAFLFMVCNIVYALPNEGAAISFRLQAMVQTVLFLGFLMGIVASQASMRKAKEVYAEEHAVKRGKSDVKASLMEMLSEAEIHNGIPEEVIEKIRQVSAEGRYLAPSSSEEARIADKAIIEDCNALMACFGDSQISSGKISDRLSRLESDIKRRKRL